MPPLQILFPMKHVQYSSRSQYDLFSDPVELERENRMQKAVIGIKRRFGKNAILKGMNLEEGAMTQERSHQIGGHRSGE